MKKTRKVRIVILITLLVIGGFFLVRKITMMFSSLDLSMKEMLPVSHDLIKEDSEIVLPAYRSGLKADRSYHSTVRGPVAVMTFDNNYYIVSYKIDLSESGSIQNIFNIEQKKVERTDDVIYTICEQNTAFRFEYQEGKPKPVKKIYFTIGGDSIQRLAYNDSCLSYHLLCRNFSLRFRDSGPIDIFVVGKDRPLGQTEIIPMDLLFLKRKDAIHLLFMTPNDSRPAIDPKLLSKIVLGD